MSSRSSAASRSSRAGRRFRRCGHAGAGAPVLDAERGILYVAAAAAALLLLALPGAAPGLLGGVVAGAVALSLYGLAHSIVSRTCRRRLRAGGLPAGPADRIRECARDGRRGRDPSLRRLHCPRQPPRACRRRDQPRRAPADALLHREPRRDRRACRRFHRAGADRSRAPTSATVSGATGGARRPLRCSILSRFPAAARPTEPSIEAAQHDGSRFALSPRRPQLVAACRARSCSSRRDRRSRASARTSGRVLAAGCARHRGRRTPARRDRSGSRSRRPPSALQERTGRMVARRDDHGGRRAAARHRGRQFRGPLRPRAARSGCLPATLTTSTWRPWPSSGLWD